MEVEEYEVFRKEPEVGIPYGITEYTRKTDYPWHYFSNKVPIYLGKFLEIGEPGDRRHPRSYIFENKNGNKVEKYSFDKTVFVKVVNDKYEGTGQVAGGRRRKRKTKKRHRTKRRRKTRRRKTRRRKSRRRKTRRKRKRKR